MKVEIRNTVMSEAEILSQIQKAAFKPLYVKYHDEGNPYLRGADDILKRLNKENRYFTILYENNMARIYIHPDYQGLGVARTAIHLCEKEFPDAETYYVDFPVDMDKNKRCYESVGFIDTGETVRWGNGPVLAMYKKSVIEKSSPNSIKLPMVYEIDQTFWNGSLDFICHASHRIVSGKRVINHGIFDIKDLYLWNGAFLVIVRVHFWEKMRLKRNSVTPLSTLKSYMIRNEITQS